MVVWTRSWPKRSAISNGEKPISTRRLAWLCRISRPPDFLNPRQLTAPFYLMSRVVLRMGEQAVCAAQPVALLHIIFQTVTQARRNSNLSIALGCLWHRYNIFPTQALVTFVDTNRKLLQVNIHWRQNQKLPSRPDSWSVDSAICVHQWV